MKKKCLYGEAAEKNRFSFTPIIVSCDAIFDIEGESYLKQLALLL